MKARLQMLLPAVFAVAGVALLSACDGADIGAGRDTGKAPTSAIESEMAVPDAIQNMAEPGRFEGLVEGPHEDCGPVDEAAGDLRRVIAIEQADGSVVGCGEAFNVLVKYGEYVDDESHGSPRFVTMENGWGCATIEHPDYPDESLVFCANEAVMFAAVPSAAFPEEPADEPADEPAEEGELQLPLAPLNNPGDVECGTLPDDPTETPVYAMETPWGTASCETAQEVMVEWHNSTNIGTPLTDDLTLLPSGWVCGGVVHPDYPDEQMIYCDSGYVEEVGEFVDGLAIYSAPNGM